MLFDAVFMDADNTLFDFDQTQNKALLQCLNYFSLPLTEDAIANYLRINHHCWGQLDRGEVKAEDINQLRWQRWLDEMGYAQTHNSAQVAAYYLASLSEQCEKEEGAEALVQRLAKKVPIHIITNGLPEAQQHRWRKAGWEGLLHGITVSAVEGVQKPDAKIFEIAMERVGVTDPSRCLMIGDNIEADVYGPQQMGMKGCWYRRNGAQNNTDIQPDFEVTHLDHIADFF
jgi:YjjG family noncanonical pyrimidine nucleotidase